MAALDPNDPTPGIRPPLDLLRDMTEDRNSWRRVAERCEREKAQAAARIAKIDPVRDAEMLRALVAGSATLHRQWGQKLLDLAYRIAAITPEDRG